MLGGFAVIPDGTGLPAALFDDLEEAMEWALRRFGGDAFLIRYLAVAEIQPEGRPAPGSAGV